MLSYQFSSSDPQQWVDQQLSGAHLHDARRNHRAVAIGQAFARHPGKSIPQMFSRKYEIDATYDFFKRPEATPENLQAGHRRLIRQEASRPGRTFLFLEDTSELSWPGNQPIAGLGPIGSGAQGLQGFLLHSVLGVRWPERAAADETGRRPPVEVLGVADQQYHVRKPRPKGKPKGDARARTRREFESELWDRAGARLGRPPGGVRWVRVADRGADIYEFLRDCLALGQGFVVRSAHDRCLEDPSNGKLFATVRLSRSLGEFDLTLRARPGQAAREARLSISATAVTLRATQRPGHPAGSLPGTACTAVRVWEKNPPLGVKRLEWILLTDAAVEDFAQAREVALQYATRWLIEEFHKALKTGLGAERLQLETAGRLFAAIAILSLVALRLIDFRERVRLSAAARAEQSGLSELELAVLRARLERPIRTVGEVALGVGRLGGHMNRKGDGWPGWQTLWKGMRELELLVQGVLLSQNVRRSQE